jgi:N-acetyl sugar amidotransferase
MLDLNMVRCTICLLPSTHETIRFNSDGVCSVCLNIDQKKAIDWDQKKIDLIGIFNPIRGKFDYDCIIPFSGGKDSTFTLLYAVNDLKLKPLVVSFDHGFYRPKLIENRNKTLKKLGVDFVSFTPNWKLVQQLMLRTFLDKGDFCWHCHTGIFSYPMWIAVEKNVPIVLWGEPSSEYTSYYDYSQVENVDEARFNRIINLGITAEDMEARLDFVFEKRDFKPFTFPDAHILAKMNLLSIPLGSFIPWDVRSQVERIKSELDWIGDEVEGVPPEYDFEKIECYMQGVRDYIKYLKRGYARTTHLTSIDIRNGKKTREESLKLVGEFEGKKPESIKLFLEYIGLEESEFMEVVKHHKISDDFNKVAVKIGPKPKDYDEWVTHPRIDRKISSKIFQDWKQKNF